MLSDEKRWPGHLCYGLFLLRSTYTWASSLHAAPITVASEEWYRWSTDWPLAVGRQAVAARLDTFSGEIRNLVPFEKQEEALWAMRIKAPDCMVDLFGLGVGYGQGEKRVYEMGELRYALRGRDASLLDPIARAERWWARFRGEKIRGRPLGSGMWTSDYEFRRELQRVVDALRAQGRKVTQEEAAKLLFTDARQLRRRIRKAGNTWDDFSKVR